MYLIRAITFIVFMGKMKHLVVLVALFASLEACEFYEKGVIAADKTTIVNKHNELRKQIANGEVGGQPRGVNLKKMKWDDKLAVAAQNIANTCKFQHQTVTDSRWQVGQNLYIQYSSAYSKSIKWNDAIQSWFDEHKVYNFSNGFSPATGHYTQVVWANSEYVGCGYIFYRESSNDFWYKKLYVCNYGPAGNYIGQFPYKVGTSGCENLC